jgi:hypothetical protein
VCDRLPEDLRSERPLKVVWIRSKTKLADERLLRCGDAETVDIDIAPLLWKLWQALGMCTLNYCQDDDGTVWLHFVSSEPAAASLNIVATPSSDERDHGYAESVRNRAVGSERSWEYDAFPVNFAEDDDPPNITMTVSIRFPISD